jgi:[acyl-carrier-protein] S-malonyltransferase
MKKVALLFPGQGSQYIGMGKDLCDNYPVAYRTFEEANDILKYDIKKICLEGDMKKLTQTENAQPAILTTSIAAFRVYMQEVGVKPEFVAGHSLGEFSALACSDAFSFSDALNIVRERGRFMQEASVEGQGTMAAVKGISPNIVAAECKKISSLKNIVTVSNYNSPEQVVISGHQAAVAQMSKYFIKIGAQVIPLQVSAPFHSPLMHSAAVKLEKELHQYTFHQFMWPVISNVTALPYMELEQIIPNLTKQMTEAVQWQASMEFLEKQGIFGAIELGPKTVLKGLMQDITKNIQVFSYDIHEDRERMIEIFSEKERLTEKTTSSNLRNKATVLTRCLAIAVCTRNQNWNNDEYQKGVVEPYHKIQQLQDELEKEGKEPTVKQMTEALTMLRSVFNTKLVPVDEQIERLNQIFEETGTRHLFPDFKLDDQVILHVSNE